MCIRDSSNAQSAGSTLQIERTTREQIERQIKLLEAENSRLKQDVSLFESLAEIDGGGADATITGLSVEPQDEPGHYRYRMLIAVRGANKACLLYTSDAADERSSVDLGGRRIIQKKTPPTPPPPPPQ